MTPQERQLISELFDRLATLEGERRDPDAERAIAQGFERAPNAAYPLVQTVLVQDEALKRANARIQELEAALADTSQQGSGGFLDTMRNSMFGREPERAPARGSVPTVHGSGMGTSGVWNTGPRPDSGGAGGSSSGAWGSRPDAGAPMAAQSPGYAPGYGGGGGSFLGTAAASAAGVIGGAMLLNGIRSMFGPSHGGGSSAFDPGLSGGGRSPWGGDASNSDLARDAGLGDIGRGGRTASYEDDDGGRRAGLFGGDDNDPGDDADSGDDGGFDGGDSDTA